ncbi:MAG: D-alanyl-D-alanine carboxypeptidase/D-alanyl-D-alanine-endopeptidase [Actinomycetota bacterium]
MRRRPRRAIIVVAVLLLLATAVPIWLLRDADGIDEDADDRADLIPIAAEATPELSGRLLTARRTPIALTAPVARDRLARSLAPFVATLPDEACLSVSLDGVRTLDVAADEPLIPASTLKLLTAVAVLETLGPDTRFVTSLVSEAPPVDGVVDGDVWVIGGGDPLLYTADYAAAFGRQPQVRTEIEGIGAAAVAAGLTSVTGSILGDEARYDTVRYLPSWPERYIVQNNTGPLSALSVNDAFTQFEAPVVHADDPAAWGALSVRAFLEDEGIVIEGGTASGSAPTDPFVLATVESLSTLEIVHQMLRESDNSTAELLIKELGLQLAGAGTWDAGTDSTVELLTRLGLPTAGLLMQDGSGLDRGNRATCDLLLTTLDAAGPDSAIADGLAVAGETGTLARRFADHPANGLLRAKTGFLNEVNGLVGFVDGRSGTTIGFSLLTNGLPVDSTEGFELQDALARLLVDQPIVPPIVDLPLAEG